MKKYIVSLIFIFVFQIAKSDVKIVQIFDKTNSDPESGKIVVEASGGCANYEVKIVGMSTNNNNETRTGINGQTTFDYLDADIYTIEVTNSSGCKNYFKVEIHNCNEINVQLQLWHICNGHDGTADAQISGGESPYMYEWYEILPYNVANLIGTNGFINSLSKGSYRLVVTDANQCKKISEFQIEEIGLGLVKATRSSICVNRDKGVIEVRPYGRKYKFEWSDNITIISDRSICEREDLIKNQDYYVIISDITTNCFVGAQLYRIGDLIIDPFVVKTIKHPITSISQDGQIVLFMDKPPNVTWPFYVDIIHEGIYIERRGLFQKNGLREIVLNNLKAGGYEFLILDLNLCEVDKVNANLFPCNGAMQNPKIQIVSYSLPPKSTNAFVKARVDNYSGDITKCSFRWYNNEYYTYTNHVPELNSQELNSHFSIAGSPDNPNLCVKLFCPCTNADAINCISIDPCKNNFNIPYKKRTITNLCDGKLPTGKYINHRSANGKIDLEIDMKNIKSGQLGLQDYKNKISKLFWSDGYQINYTYDQNKEILYISRIVVEEKVYTLFLTDGSGCEKLDAISISNDFDIVQTYLPHCFFKSGCRNGVEQDETHHEQRIVITNLDECKAELRCGSTKIKDLFGDDYRYYDAYQQFEEDGHCYIRRICAFYDEQIDWQNPNYLKYLLQPGHPELGQVIVVVTKIPVPCCDFNEFGSYDDIRSRLYHVNIIGNQFNKIDLTGSNPCQAYLLCPTSTTHKLVVGTKIEESTCRLNEITCFKCVKCAFNVGNNTFTSTTFQDDHFSSCDVIECAGNNYPNCLNGPPPQQISNFSNSHPIIYPNPFINDFRIYLNGYFKSNIIHIKLINYLGKSIENITVNLLPFQSTIDYIGKTQECGLYYINLSDGFENFNISLIKL